ncbi:hypothetical protein ACFL04_04560 [Patescibacteria group bacterium]
MNRKAKKKKSRKISTPNKTVFVRIRSKNIYTLSEAQRAGYGTTDSIKKQILRGVLPAEKVEGVVWLVHKRYLEQMVSRRKKWLSKRSKSDPKQSRFSFIKEKDKPRKLL